MIQPPGDNVPCHPTVSTGSTGGTPGGQRTLTVGRTTSVTSTVTDADTALALGSGTLPVLATPRLIAWCERAACDALTGALSADQTTVGTHLALDHLAATPVGAPVTATATITAVDGRRIDFALEATDPGSTIATGTHTRVIVDAARFVERARSRL